MELGPISRTVPTVVTCRTGILLPGVDSQPRFSYVSAGSPIEQILPSPNGSSGGVAIRSEDDSPLDVDELCRRLVDGEVAGVLAPLDSANGGRATTADHLLADFVNHREKIRFDNVQMRFILRQIGLAEVSTHRGAPPTLYRRAEALWSLDLALCTDPAMMLTLGADRQRYVDRDFEERAFDRLPRALGRLHDLGIRSYPRLVIV